MDKKVRICVDELGVIPDPGNKEPIRALSLNRLNISGDRDREVEPLYKCPSFPRLSSRYQRGHRNHSTELYPNTQHADSVSVQPSLDNLSPGVESDDHGGMLPRCSSARAVGEGDRLPPLDYNNRPGSSNHLSVTPASASQLVARSTSCPVIHPDSPRARSSHGSPRHSPQLLPQGPAEPDLEGEVITDLPIEAGQTFPDFFPVPEEPRINSSSSSSTNLPFEEHPMHTRRIRERPSGDLAQYSNGRMTKTLRKKSSMMAATAHKDGFLNIRDIPSSLAQKVILEQDVAPFVPEQRDKVQVKCIKWLNTLNNNN